MRGRPPIIVCTMILSALSIITWVSGLPRDLYLPLNGINAWMGSYQALLDPAIFSTVVRLLLLPGLACSVIYAGVRRPLWERPVFFAYCLLVSGLMWVAALSPHPHASPMSAAEQAGYTMGQWIAGLLPAYYVYRMLFGGRAKQYFKRVQPSALTTIDSVEATG